MSSFAQSSGTSGQIIIVMGVSGCGKTTVGELLAERLGYTFLDADDLHPQANIDKMSRGLPLDDADRMPWLEALAAALDVAAQSAPGAVLACSALKKSYRDILASGGRAVRFVYLEGSADLVAERLRQRQGHFMSPDLLASQFDTLEVPCGAIKVGIDQPVDAIVEETMQRLAGRP